MEMTFEQDLWRQPAAMMPEMGLHRALRGGVEVLDWHALAARLAAAHAFCRVAGSAPQPRAGGSFHPAAARRISTFIQAIEGVCDNAVRSEGHNLRFVNLVNSAVRKSTGGKAMSVAGSHSSGDRG